MEVCLGPLGLDESYSNGDGESTSHPLSKDDDLMDVDNPFHDGPP